MQPQNKPGSRRKMMINPRASLAGVDAANGQCWYEIRALAAGRVEIFLYDVIGGWGSPPSSLSRTVRRPVFSTPAQWICIFTVPVAM